MPWGQDEPEALPWGQDKGQPEAFAELDTPQIDLDETSLAGEYLEKYSQRKKDTGRMYGIRSAKGKYFMGGKRVIIDHDSNWLLMVKDIGDRRSSETHCYERARN